MKSLFCLPNLPRKQRLVRPTHDQHVNIACRIGFSLGEGAEDPGRHNAVDQLKSPLQRRLDTYGGFEQGKNWLQVGVAAIDAVVELAAFRLRLQESLAGQASQFAGEVGGIGVERDGQLAHVHPCIPVKVEEGQHLTPQLGTERKHRSANILHMQSKCTFFNRLASLNAEDPVPARRQKAFIPLHVAVSQAIRFGTALFVQRYLSFSVRWVAAFARALRTEMVASPGPWPFQKAVAADRFSVPVLKHDICQSLNSGSIIGYRASPRPDRPVFTNPIHLAVKPAARASDRCQWTRCGFLDERVT